MMEGKVLPRDALDELRWGTSVDAAEPFHDVGLWYEDFSQTTDDEVRALLERSAAPVEASTGPDEEPTR